MNNIIEFKDYLDIYSNISKNNWITLYENIKNEENNIKNDIYAITVLTENNKYNKDRVLSQENWGFSIDSFGQSYFQKIYSKNEDKIEFCSGEKQDIYEYLITIRTFNDKYPKSIEINPKLIWYKNLVKVNDDYVNPENDEVLIKCTDSSIKIKTSYFKDFLSAYNYIGVIAFDHRRFFESDSKIRFDSKDYKNKNMIIQYAINCYTYSEKNAMSSIIGKVIIEPFEKPLHEDYIEYTEEKKYENFIIEQNLETGKAIEFTCNENKLGNLFGANPNSPQFLTPVYFNKKILNHYTTDTKNYKVLDSLIIYLDKWSIPYSVNDENKVVVWLGDLGRIPFNEQQLWKIYNEFPTGEVEELFLRRQIMCEWTESSIKEKGILSKINSINEIFKERYGEKLFKDISSTDEEIESAILIPATNSVPVYQSFLMQLSKMTIERINKNFIKNNLSEDLIYDKDKKEYGSRILLHSYLKSLNINNADKLDNIFKVIYNSRNKLSGHTGSVTEYNKVWKRDKNYKPNYISDAKLIIVSLYNVLNELEKELSHE